MADLNWNNFLSAFEQNPAAWGALAGGIGAMIDPAQATTTTQTQNVQLPEYIAPYAGRMLGRQESLSNEAYNPYPGQRLADFTPDQQAAFEQMRNMGPMSPQQQQAAGWLDTAANQLHRIGQQQVGESPYTTQGAGIVGEAARNLMGLSGQRWDQAAAEHYMSPYQQSVTDIAKREALRDYGKQLPQMAASAQKAGAFGGSRHGIMQAEAQRNMNQQLQDLQTTGLQSAYTNAQGQFNADANRRSQGYGAAGALGSSLGGIGGQQQQLQQADLTRQGNVYAQAPGMANTLAGIGQTGFQNQLALNQGLMGIGQQQQGLNQQSLDTGYQDFLRQQQHPYDQLRFMQAGLQGMPMTQYSTANFTPAPSWSQQVIGSAAGGAGLASLFNPQQRPPRP